MDFDKIFIKDCCPTKTGGQAVMEGVMMRGPERTAVAVRLPDNRIFLKTEMNPKRSSLAKLPLVRGVIAFVTSLVLGTKILTYSADVLEYFTELEEDKAAEEKAYSKPSDEDESEKAEFVENEEAYRRPTEEDEPAVEKSDEENAEGEAPEEEEFDEEASEEDESGEEEDNSEEEKSDEEASEKDESGEEEENSDEKVLGEDESIEEKISAEAPGEEAPDEEKQDEEKQEEEKPAEVKPTEEKPGWLERTFGKKTAWNILLFLSVAFALIVSVVVFVLLPTVIVNLLSGVISNVIVLNLIEGLFRIAMFLGYIVLISKMKDIQRVFEYHGAEHKTIHCYENGKELTPDNAKDFVRLHPRCGTSFLMFVMVISLILFSLLGWPNLAMRIISRIVLIPVVAAISYEILQWAGRSTNRFVEIVSVPGLLLQKLTTREPDASQLEVAIVSMKAVLVPPETPVFEGISNTDAEFVEPMKIDRDE